MEILSDPTPDMLAMPRFDDGAIDMQELLRRLAEQVVNAVMDAEADQLCGGGTNSLKRLPREVARHLRRHADAAHPQAALRQLLPGGRARAPPAPAHARCSASRRRWESLGSSRTGERNYADMESKSCELTALGKQYWRLAYTGKI